MRNWRLIFQLSLILTMYACGSTQSSNSSLLKNHREWQSKINKEHPLVGKIWHAASGHTVIGIELESAIQMADYLLIGEKHDNPDHHLLEQMLIEYKIGNLEIKYGLPVVSFEMLDRKQLEGVTQQQLSKVRSSFDIKKLLNWPENGWVWKDYRDAIHSAVVSGARIAAANIEKTALISAAGSDRNKLDQELRRAFITIDSMSEQMHAAVLDDVYEGHCQLMPRKRLKPMVATQEMRDSYMAFSLTSGKEWKGVLIAGNGHIRKDYGAGWHLAQRKPQAKIVAIALIEAEENKTIPAQYIHALNNRSVVYDFIWFTPKINKIDECEKLKEHFKNRTYKKSIINSPLSR